MSPNASHRVRPGLSSAASLITTLLISFDQEVLNQHLNLVTPEYPFFESPCLVSRAWRAFGLQPHRQETFKLSSDPAFIDKVRDVVGLYLAPPERALVLCVDEKPQIQAAQGTAPTFPIGPGQPERRTHDYRR